MEWNLRLWLPKMLKNECRNPKYFNKFCVFFSKLRKEICYLVFAWITFLVNYESTKPTKLLACYFCINQNFTRVFLICGTFPSWITCLEEFKQFFLSTGNNIFVIPVAYRWVHICFLIAFSPRRPMHSLRCF